MGWTVRSDPTIRRYIVRKDRIWLEKTGENEQFSLCKKTYPLHLIFGSVVVFALSRKFPHHLQFILILLNRRIIWSEWMCKVWVSETGNGERESGRASENKNGKVLRFWFECRVPLFIPFAFGCSVSFILDISRFVYKFVFSWSAYF